MYHALRVILFFSLTFLVSWAATAQTTTYTYDNMGRLSTATFATNPQTWIAYTYDNAGNRTQMAITAPSCPTASWTQAKGTQYNYTVSCFDPGTWSITAVSNPGCAGTLYANGAVLTFQSVGVACNQGPFTYTVSDASGHTATMNGTITVQ